MLLLFSYPACMSGAQQSEAIFRRGFDGEKRKKAERGGTGSKANFKGRLIKEGFGFVFDSYV